MIRCLGMCLIAGLSLASVASVNAEEIRKLTQEAKAWEKKDKDNNLARLKDEDDRVKDLSSDYSISVDKGIVVLRTGWSHKGVSSKSTQERDAFAASALFDKAKQLMADWNQEFGIEKKTFGGVQYLKTEGGWSETEGPSLSNGNKRSYKAGGTAVGYILVDPYK